MAGSIPDIAFLGAWHSDLKICTFLCLAGPVAIMAAGFVL